MSACFDDDQKLLNRETAQPRLDGEGNKQTHKKPLVYFESLDNAPGPQSGLPGSVLGRFCARAEGPGGLGPEFVRSHWLLTGPGRPAWGPQAR
jgi:hypothetical protein